MERAGPEKCNQGHRCEASGQTVASTPPAIPVDQSREALRPILPLQPSTKNTRDIFHGIAIGALSNTPD
ncbi:unnamed protein product [Zymoseptoria tritici ST99CH_3D7]|uniref:Uncharacterized protein n=1 Tax=Zymoseptoria tritici (strain ST99CH_3D7) TaxID=1276538 RepID=A0A1X7S7P0_ZYMT9|nr:unnamed protein product [Zymoseptoria tritici ST99CH_3D7]